MRRVTVLALCLIFAPVISAHERCPKAECEEIKQKIRLVRAKMRQGYTRARGERLADELRKLRALRSKKCR